MDFLKSLLTLLIIGCFFGTTCLFAKNAEECATCGPAFAACNQRESTVSIDICQDQYSACRALHCASISG